MNVGTTYPAEWREYLDPMTGRRVRQLTRLSAADYHLYFDNPSVTPDANYLVFYSERSGVSNLFPEEVLRQEKFWINHVHVNPYDRDLVLFCHENSDLPDRMWLLDVPGHKCEPILRQGVDEW